MQSDRAVLLLNMGGVNSIDEVEMFLRNMFSDKHILPTNPLMRKFIGNLIVKKRLDEAKENYKLLGGKSPLTEITQKLCEKLKSKIPYPVYPAMRYVPPFADEALKALKGRIDELILFPMYPHYSTTTTLSSVEDIKDRLKRLNFSPKLKVIEPYYNDKEYIDIQCDLIEDAIKDRESSEYELILSAHGLPMSIIKAGDPYQSHIETNVRLIQENLDRRGVKFKDITLAYQSKVGKGRWLEPNLIDILRSPNNLKVLIFPLSFTIDNSETIFELDIEHREIAQKIGYDDYIVAKCPNTDDRFIDFIAKKVQE